MRPRLVIVPTRSAARLAERTVGSSEPSTRFVTRDEFYDALCDRLPGMPPRLTPFARDAMMQAAGREASPAVRLRPGLVTEMLHFYDQLRRQGRNVTRFEELLDEALSRDAEFDRGAERMLAQGRVLAATFQGYERRVAASGWCDEHVLRGRLIEEASADPIRDIVVTVGDWIADPSGLYLADFDLLTRLPGAETVAVVATEGLLAAGFHERVHEWLPGIEEVGAGALGVPLSAARPVLLVPAPAAGTGPAHEPAPAPCFVVRDREEELIAVARRAALHRQSSAALERTAVVYKRPLPYLYLAREVFGGAGIPYQTSDTLPLAAEPFAAAVDLVFEFVESGFTRTSLVALLLSPHFVLDHGHALGRAAIGALDRYLAKERYLGGLDRLIDLAALDAAGEANAALRVGQHLAVQLSSLVTLAPASTHVRTVIDFIDDHIAPSTDDDPFAERTRRARAAIRDTLVSLEAAHASFDDAPVEVSELAVNVRRWIEEQTFADVGADGQDGVHLLDDQAARYGTFDDIAIVGVMEHEWPERPHRNIFYPASLLTRLGWPSEQDRRGAAQARFLDLLASAARTVSVFTVTLDDEALVEPSALIDDIGRAHLSVVTLEAAFDGRRVFVEESLSLEPVDVDALPPGVREWARLRIGRSPATDPVFHGSVFPDASAERRVVGQAPARAWSVSALETYLDCPFKFFARHVLRLEEELEDEEVMDPRREGTLVHLVFETFFRRWQDSGHQAITTDNIGVARALFVEVVDACLADLSETEAALARTQLLGSPAAAGLGEAVLRMEAERPVPVVGRHLEYPLKGDFVFATNDGPRTVSLRGKADRLDLLADGTFRLIDYKLGSPPQKARALQLPVYSICAEQQLRAETGKSWTLGEAAYVAFRGPKRVAPLVGPRDDRDKVLADAQQRLVDTLDAIARGEFPPHPGDVFRCDTCSYAAVCRKDYVGDV